MMRELQRLPKDSRPRMSTSTAPAEQEINIAHSPDSDDAFMFYGLATNKIRVPGYRFNHTLTDIETLNHRAITDAFYDVTAISFHAYPYVQENYAIMACGGSMGDGYGPMIVAPKKYTLDEVKKLRIAVPGMLTSAYLALKLVAPDVKTTAVPFDQIIPAVVAGDFDAGLIIHEGQLTYAGNGLHKILDLGVWWGEETGGLPLPLGCNAIKRSLGDKAMKLTTQALKDSIQHALDHREGALEYAMQFARDLDPALANKFVGMYVNDRTLDYGDDGRKSIQLFLERGYDAGIIPSKAKIDFIG
jgi:1,4-dihydroxy-6-naphthoate synthase